MVIAVGCFSLMDALMKALAGSDPAIQVAAVAPFEYTALTWGLDWLLWHTVPGHATLLGGAIIIASGLYVVRKERLSS